MINERSPVIRRSPQQHYQYDRFYPNPNPNPKPLPKHHASMDWTGSGEPMSGHSQFSHQEKDWGLNLASSNTGSSLPSYMVSASGEARGGGSRFKSRALELPSVSTAGAAAAMRDVYNRTKVVVRHLPPGLSESAFMEQIASRFSSMYNMVSFCPGKSSIKGSSFSRAYIDFKHPEDVLDFYQGFNGHVFVNEKGTQFKALVEYAPNQRVPKLWIKKDPREGSIFQDQDYIKFTEQVSKPVEYLPSAEAQLERKETERNLSSVAGAKEAIIVTPLMEFVRQRRALKSMPQKSLAAGKISVRGGASSMVLKRGARYSPGPRPKEKATYVPRYEEGQRRDVLADKKGRVVLEAKNIPEDFSNKAGERNQGTTAVKSGIELAGVKGFVAGKKIVSGVDKEELINGVASGNSGSLSDSKSGAPVGRTRGAASAKSPAAAFLNNHNAGGDDSSLIKASQRIESGGRLSKGASSSRTPFLLQKSDQQNERDKRFSKSQVWKTSSREVNAADLESGSFTEDRNDASRQDGRRLRNKDRPDRPVWTVRQRGDSAESPKNLTVGPSLSPPGSQRPGRGPRDFDNSIVPDASKPPIKRAGSSTVYGGHEKQVWVAKPGSGS
ncbi:hypothetical protein GOP47_0010378 [Adiantum capillus-veneris]|uniref:UPF3 domain-containing protein n=1 Tax=Adiantum capillus-veneris TaxID=13818 RepID=A0A9D4UV60_ADICA|nr:hypothetical protein GOP47_0010378 [Adiantum capillus-veneris]